MDYPVISNKTVRKNEKFLAIFYSKTGGKLQQTNRGYFLNGLHISFSSAQHWLLEHNKTQPNKVIRSKSSKLLGLTDDDRQRKLSKQKRDTHRSKNF